MAILGPHVATALVIGFSGHMLQELNEKALKAIDEKNNFKLLDLLHHYSSGIKAFSTEYCY